MLRGCLRGEFPVVRRMKEMRFTGIKGHDNLKMLQYSLWNNSNHPWHLFSSEFALMIGKNTCIESKEYRMLQGKKEKYKNNW